MSMQSTISGNEVSITHLPSEILLEIFRIHINVNQQSQLSLYTCKFWRSLVFGIPSFWNVICLHDHYVPICSTPTLDGSSCFPPSAQICDTPEKVLDAVERAGYSLIDLRICKYWNAIQGKGLKGETQEKSQRRQQMEKMACSALANRCYKLVIHSRIPVADQSNTVTQLLLDNLPLLESVEVLGQYNSPQNTECAANRMMRSLIEHSPRLSQLKWELWMAYPLPEALLHNLCSLSLKFDSSGAFRRFIRIGTLPKLHELHIRADDAVDSNISGDSYSDINLPSLHSLRLENVDICFLDCLSNWQSNLATLEELYIRLCYSEFPQTHRYIFSNLKRLYIEKGETQLMPIFETPVLYELSIAHHDVYWDKMQSVEVDAAWQTYWREEGTPYNPTVLRLAIYL